MIILVVVLVLSLLFGFICYMAAKTWRIAHVVLLFGVFLMALIFVILSAASLKTHQGWMEKYQDLTAQLEQQHRQLELLEHGDVLTADDENKSLVALSGEFARLVVDRGRVWRNVKPAQVEGAVGLNMTGWGDARCLSASGEGEEDDLEPIPEEGAQPAAPVVDHGITAGMVVFGFLEGSTAQMDAALKTALFGESELPAADTKGFCRVPVYYTGSFRVEKVDGNNLTLMPVVALDPQQVQAIQAADATWTLYEVLPVDSHDALAGMSEESIGLLFQGQPLVAQDYIRDMTAAQPGDPENRTMRKVKFLRDFEVVVDVDGEEPGIDKNFSPDGRAILPHLRQGEPTEFTEGEIPDVFFPTQVANRWRRDGVCEFVDEQPLYMRPLRDYRYYFYQKNAQIEQLRDLMATLKRENESIAATETRARDQQAYRENELGRLKQDRSRTDEELRLLESYLTGLQSDRQEQLSGLGSLYQWNNQQAAELRGSRFYGAENR